MSTKDTTQPSLDEAGPPRTGITRRNVLAGGAVGGLAIAGLGGILLSGREQGPSRSPIMPDSPLVAATEQARPHTGKTVSMDLNVAPGTVDFAGRTAATSLYGDRLTGPEIRANVGDQLTVRVRNAMEEPTSVHWHGLALRNDMDGVPGVTQDQIPASTDFTYSYTVPHSGTYWYHSHTGMQRDRGLYGPLIFEDPSEPAIADVEHVVVFDDWLDGLGRTPEEAFAELSANGMGAMGGMDMSGGGAGGGPLGIDTGDVVYPLHLINGRPPEDQAVLEARPGQRVRLRLINAGADTAYRFAVGGHKLTVTHADGFPVVPVEVDSLILGMAERYDVVVTAGDGAFPVVAVPEGKDGQPAARAVLRTTMAQTPPADAVPTELSGKLLTYRDLAPAADVVLPSRPPDRQTRFDLGLLNAYQWQINGRSRESLKPFDIAMDERVRLTFANNTGMFHPMHVHGHTFALTDTGVRKDTIIVLPGAAVSVDLQADNPGQWLVHCHNAYHMASGMATLMSYVT